MAPKKHDSEILTGIPSGVWADAWATHQEEKGRSFGGGVKDDFIKLPRDEFYY